MFPPPTRPQDARPAGGACPWTSPSHASTTSGDDAADVGSADRLSWTSEATEHLRDAGDEDVRQQLAAMVAAQDYPCVGAKSVYHRDQVEVLVLDELADDRSTARLLDALASFSAAHPRQGGDQPLVMASFIAAFRSPVPSTEAEFEDLLWRQLALLVAADASEWDDAVSTDPADAHFGFSVAGRAFFVIGMHPASSRQARRSPMPALVFNLHSQFEQLRASGKYDRMRDTVRTRDVRLQGSTNPMVADHGVRSEARQYSGRMVADDWRPPHDLTPKGPQ